MPSKYTPSLPALFENSPASLVSPSREQQYDEIIAELERINDIHNLSIEDCRKIALSVADPRTVIRTLRSVKFKENRWDYGQLKIQQTDDALLLILETRVFSESVMPDIRNFRTAQSHIYAADINGTPSDFKSVDPTSIPGSACISLRSTSEKVAVLSHLEKNRQQILNSNSITSIPQKGVITPITLCMQHITIMDNNKLITKYVLSTVDGASRVTKCQEEQKVPVITTLDGSNIDGLRDYYRVLKKNVKDWPEKKNKIKQLELNLSSSDNKTREALEAEIQSLVSEGVRINAQLNTWTLPAKIIIGFAHNPNNRPLHRITAVIAADNHVDVEPWSDASCVTAKSQMAAEVLRNSEPLSELLTGDQKDLYWDILLGHKTVDNLEPFNLAPQKHIRTLLLIWHTLAEENADYKEIMGEKSKHAKKIGARSEVFTTLYQRVINPYLTVELGNPDPRDFFTKMASGFYTKPLQKRIANGWIPTGKNLFELKEAALKCCQNDMSQSIDNITDEQFEIAVSAAAILQTFGMIERSTGRQKEIFKLNRQPTPTEFCLEAVRSEWGVVQMYDVLEKFEQNGSINSMYIIDPCNLSRYKTITSGKTYAVVNNKNLRETLRDLFPAEYLDTTNETDSEKPLHQEYDTGSELRNRLKSAVKALEQLTDKLQDLNEAVNLAEKDGAYIDIDDDVYKELETLRYTSEIHVDAHTLCAKIENLEPDGHLKKEDQASLLVDNDNE